MRQGSPSLHSNIGLEWFWRTGESHKGLRTFRDTYLEKVLRKRLSRKISPEKTHLKKTFS